MSAGVYSFLYLEGSFSSSLFSKYYTISNPFPPTKVIFSSVPPSCCNAISGQCSSLYTSLRPSEASSHSLPLLWRAWGPKKMPQVRPMQLKFLPSHWSSPFSSVLETRHLEVTCSVFRLYPRKLIDGFLCSRITQICYNFILLSFLNLTLQVEMLNYVSVINWYLSSSHIISHPTNNVSLYVFLALLFAPKCLVL